MRRLLVGGALVLCAASISACGAPASDDASNGGAETDDALMQVEPTTVVWTDPGPKGARAAPRLAGGGDALVARSADGQRIVSISTAASATTGGAASGAGRVVSTGQALSAPASSGNAIAWLERSSDNAASARLVRFAGGQTEAWGTVLGLGEGARVAMDDAGAYVTVRDADGSEHVAEVRRDGTLERRATVCAERSDCMSTAMILDVSSIYVATGGAAGGGSVVRINRASGTSERVPLQGGTLVVATRIVALAADANYVFISLGGQGLLRFDKARGTTRMAWAEAADSPLAMDASYVYFKTKWGDVFSLDKDIAHPPQRVARLPDGSAYDFVLSGDALYASMRSDDVAQIVKAPLTPRRPERAR